MPSEYLLPQAERHHLPRLGADYYRGFAAVLWTIPMARRSEGWLDLPFHLTFRELLLHASLREHLFCPAYVLMPDHIHLFWLGVKARSDQRLAMRFLRKHLAVALAAHSRPGAEFRLEKQSHDSVMQEKDRRRGALASACFYVLDNPRRKGLVAHPRDWPSLGAVVPGCPFLHPLDETFWPQFWKIYTDQRDALPTGPQRLEPPTSPS